MTFKENCPDIRNSRVMDIIRELQDFGCRVSVFDPWADPLEVKEEYGLTMLSDLAEAKQTPFNAVVVAVGHNEFREIDPRSLVSSDGVVFDVKGIFDKNAIDGRL
jgi:UDP-N-acetyl-D-galactosamine dehydrogenase